MINDLMSTQQVAKRLGVSRQRVDQLILTPGFPKEAGRLGSGRVWMRAEIEAYIHQYREAGMRLAQPLKPPSSGV